MQLQVGLEGATVVLLGSFNPAIFHPAWFAANGLIREEEARAAEIEIVHPNAAVFRTEWLVIESARDRFLATTILDAYYEPLRDLVVGVLDLLSHTPLTAMGLNRDFHYSGTLWTPAKWSESATSR